MNHNLNRMNFQKLLNLTKRYHLKELYLKLREKQQAPYQDYPQNWEKQNPTKAELLAQQKTSFYQQPTISIVVPAYETDQTFLCQMLDSICGQSYANWELCIVDGSSSTRVEKIISQKYAWEKRIRYRKLKENRGISENTNEGIAMATGAYIGLLDHDDFLSPSALYEIVKCINETGAELIYSDEDKVFASGKEHVDPHYKLDFNRELLLGNNYICHFLVVAASLLRETGLLRPEFDGAQDFDLVLRCSEKANRVAHVGKILYHWRMHSGSTAGNTDSKLYAYEAGKRAVAAALKRQGWQGTVSMGKELGFYRTRYAVPKGIKVGFYLWGEPSKHFDSLWRQIKTELSQAGCILVEQQKNRDKVDFILVINRKLCSYHTKSAPLLLASCSRQGIAVVGAKTLVGKKVAQCGYENRQEGWQPQYAGLPAKYKGYYRRAYLATEADAVTNLFAVVSAKAWQQAELDAVAPEKINAWQTWCYALKKQGYRIIVEPQGEVNVIDRN